MRARAAPQPDEHHALIELLARRDQMKVKRLARAASRSRHQAGNKPRSLRSSPQGDFAYEREITMSGEITTAVSERAESHSMMIPAYTFTARVLHWTTAFLILFIIALGIVIAND
jgi:hypothetical protein